MTSRTKAHASKGLATRETGTLALATLNQHQHRLAAMPLYWHPRGAPDQLDPGQLDIPDAGTLAVMQDQARHGLEPAGMQMGAAAAAIIIDSYPQKDMTTPTYAEQLARRLAECPPDLLPLVCDQVVNACIEWRPTPGQVAQVVGNVTATRALMKRRIEQAIAWRKGEIDAARLRAEVEADRLAASDRVVLGLSASLRAPGKPPPTPPPPSDVPARPVVKARHVTGAQLAALRKRAV